MLVQAALCRTCSETTLLVFPRGGSFVYSVCLSVVIAMFAVVYAGLVVVLFWKCVSSFLSYSVKFVSGVSSFSPGMRVGVLNKFTTSLTFYFYFAHEQCG